MFCRLFLTKSAFLWGKLWKNWNCAVIFCVFFFLELLKLGEIGGEKFLAWKSGGVKFWTNSMSVWEEADQCGSRLKRCFHINRRNTCCILSQMTRKQWRRQWRPLSAATVRWEGSSVLSPTNAADSIQWDSMHCIYDFVQGSFVSSWFLTSCL